MYNFLQQILSDGRQKSERACLNLRDKPARTLCLPENRWKMADEGWKMAEERGGEQMEREMKT